MRAAVFTILLLVIYQGEALKCNVCFSNETDLCTPTKIQTCSGETHACGIMILTGPPSLCLRQCMIIQLCEDWISTPESFLTCCSTDLCN
ncbi:hypothetical protein KUCAC02_000972 [Chaenocephalus aceratus]|uniref:Uncharacterized protein n=1 Tax=Chaenocephalus aceratus TaxID=36190 RepID=A0ACB9XW65_CHAAC|nr:hypothetical protein KUCAC02_000972 [Chaenocephalus aceratus]